ADQHCDRLASPRLSWERLDAPMMSDVFALSDEYVMCWSAIGDTQLFYVFDGARTRPIPAPASWILGVHGCAPDWIVAVGEHGTRPAGMERHGTHGPRRSPAPSAAFSSSHRTRCTRPGPTGRSFRGAATAGWNARRRREPWWASGGSGVSSTSRIASRV